MSFGSWVIENRKSFFSKDRHCEDILVSELSNFVENY